MAVVDKTVRGRGCSVCSGYKVVSGINDLASQRPDIALLYDKELNELSPDKVMVNSSKKAMWICSSCSFSWRAAVVELTREGGRASNCPCCGKRALHVGCSDLATTHPALALEWSIKNSLPASAYRRGSRKRVIWNCLKCKNEWEAVIKDRSRPIRGSKCKKCSTNGTSNMEKLFRERFLSNKNVIDASMNNSKAQGRSGKNYQVDIWFEYRGLSVIVEYDGELYHGTYFDPNKEQKDIAKTRDLIEAGYIVVRIRENKLFHLGYSSPGRFHQFSFYYKRSNFVQRIEETVDIILERLI